MRAPQLALAAAGRRDNVLFVRQGAADEADNPTVRQGPSRPQLKRDPLGSGAMSKRDDEEFAKETFTRFLATSAKGSSAWAEGADPPDYVLTWNGLRYAVEVTQVMESFELGPRPLSYMGMSQSLRALTKRIEARAISAGLLEGTYGLALDPIPNLANREAELTDAVIRVLSTRPGPRFNAWTPVLFGSEGTLVEIMKLTQDGSALCEVIGGGGPKWGGQIVQEASALISRALGSKAERLKAVAGNHVLLLIDEYHYAPTEMWRAVIDGAPLLRARFHTIARIHGDHDCRILWSLEPGWQAAA